MNPRAMEGHGTRQVNDLFVQAAILDSYARQSLSRHDAKVRR
ncbi:hypothetical protein [Micromonospora sp. DT229]